MAILNVNVNQVGQAGVFPALVYILTNDTVAEVTTAGYLNGLVKQNIPLSEADMALVTTKTTPNATSTQVGWYEVSKSGDNWSLVPPGGAGSVTLPTIANHIATYTNTTGTLSEDPTTAISGGNIQAGLSGTAGYFASFPATAANGSLILAAVNAGGAFNTTISNGTMAQSTVYTLGDIGAATGGIVVATSAIRMKSVAGAVVAGGAAAQTITDAFCTSASNVVGNWNTQTNAVTVQKIVPGNGSFVVTSSGDPGASTFNYIIIK